MPEFDRTRTKTARARFLRRQGTDVENLLWSRLRDERLGYRFRRQHPAGPYVLDFYSAPLGLVVELDGGQHGDGVQASRDVLRDKWLHEHGLRVLRFWNSDITQNLSGVLERIKAVADEMAENVTPTGRWRADLPLSGGGDDSDPVTVNVGLGERAYDIVIGRGLIATLGTRIAALRPGARAAIVTDRTVAKHWLEAAEAALKEADVGSFRVVVEEGESSKSYAVFEQVCEALIGGKLERNDLVVALGGGVIGDLAGFAAAAVRRGVEFVQVPTSLLAQVDSSVGGKTGINSPLGKNLIGAFHQPVLVVADTAVLDTLSPRQFRAGYAEVAKYGALGDVAFFSWLETNHRDLFAGSAAAREYAVAVSCRAKAAIVARDERETGDRMLLNLGHTFGHALEGATGFSDRLLHGEGVSIGMVLAADLSAELGMMPQADADRLRSHLRDVGLPVAIREIAGFGQGDITTERLVNLMAQDKKVRRGQMTFILMRALGEAGISRDVDPAKVQDFIARKLAA